MIVDKGEVYRHYDSDREDVQIDIINEDDEEAESSQHSQEKQDNNKGD